MAGWHLSTQNFFCKGCYCRFHAAFAGGSRLCKKKRNAGLLQSPWSRLQMPTCMLQSAGVKITSCSEVQHHFFNKLTGFQTRMLPEEIGVGTSSSMISSNSSSSAGMHGASTGLVLLVLGLGSSLIFLRGLPSWTLHEGRGFLLEGLGRFTAASGMTFSFAVRGGTTLGFGFLGLVFGCATLSAWAV